jgi:hypothetical protein
MRSTAWVFSWWSRAGGLLSPCRRSDRARWFHRTDGVYWTIADTEGIPPALYISRRNVISFNNKPNRVHTAISGDRMIVLKGGIAPDLDDQEVDPRTAVGINRNGRYLYLIVVDGRQPLYSVGATFAELAQLLIDQGACGLSLDGGGSLHHGC